MRRALLTVLIWVGLRPGEALYLRWSHLRDAFGMLDHIEVRGALKDIAGELEEGDTKTHTNRDAITFSFVQQELDELYHALGAPKLRARVFPNRSGGPLRWDNFRDRAWYKALHRAGIAEKLAEFLGQHRKRDREVTRIRIRASHRLSKRGDGRSQAGDDDSVVAGRWHVRCLRFAVGQRLSSKPAATSTPLHRRRGMLSRRSVTSRSSTT